MLVVDDTDDVSEQDCDCDYDDDDENEDVEQVEVVEEMRVQLDRSDNVQKNFLAQKINLPALAAAAARATVC